MATLVFFPEVDPIADSRQGVTFSTGPAGTYAKRRPAPINRQTTHRQNTRAILSAAGKYFWSLPNGLKKLWANWGNANGITKPFPKGVYQLANAAFLCVEVPAKIAGDPFYATPPGNLPLTGVTFLTLTRINNNTIRATFSPSPAGTYHRICLRQAIPGPGVRRTEIQNGYLCEPSGLNPTSPHDFTTHFQHLSGWHCRYWVTTQETTGRRSLEAEFDL